MMVVWKVDTETFEQMTFEVKWFDTGILEQGTYKVKWDDGAYMDKLCSLSVGEWSGGSC